MNLREGNLEDSAKSRINANQGSSWENFDLVDTLGLLSRSFSDFNPVDKEATLRESFSQGASSALLLSSLLEQIEGADELFWAYLVKKVQLC